MHITRKRSVRILSAAVIAIALGGGLWFISVNKLYTDPTEARIDVSDVERFLVTMDSLTIARNAADSIRIVEKIYIRPGSPGLKALLKSRIGDSKALIAQMDSHPMYYAHLSQSLSGVSQTKARIVAAFDRFKTIYPSARFADVGYWVGYRIAQSYYNKAADKTLAIGHILGGLDAETLLARSGYDGRAVTPSL